MRRLDKRGMTILEIIVTIMVLAIALTILTSGIFTANNLMKEGRHAQQALDNQTSALNGTIANTTKLDKEKQSMSFMVNGSTYRFSGTALTGRDTLYDDIHLQGFTLKESLDYSVEYQAYLYMKGMPDVFRDLLRMGSEEKQQVINVFQSLGSTVTSLYLNNDEFIMYMFHYYYGRNWPDFNKELQKQLPESLQNKAYVIRTFMSSPINDSSTIIVYATEYTSAIKGSWGTSLIYDYGDGEDPNTAAGWYYMHNTGATCLGRKGSCMLTDFNNNAHTWSELQRELRNTNVWTPLGES